MSKSSLKMSTNRNGECLFVLTRGGQEVGVAFYDRHPAWVAGKLSEKVVCWVQLHGEQRRALPFASVPEMRAGIGRALQTQG